MVKNVCNLEEELLPTELLSTYSKNTLILSI